RIPTSCARPESDLEHGCRAPARLEPLPPARLRVGVRELLVRHTEGGRAIRPRRAPVDRGGRVVAELPEAADLRREQSRLCDLGDLDLLRIALLCSLAPEGREVGRERE